MRKLPSPNLRQGIPVSRLVDRNYKQKFNPRPGGSLSHLCLSKGVEKTPSNSETKRARETGKINRMLIKKTVEIMYFGHLLLG